jgi:biopolymer transport protein ExbD
MRFYLRKRRQPPAVIIVAMIDVLIVVLIFLMVTTTFKKPLPPVAQLRLALPTSTTAPKVGASESPPLVVAIEANGTLHLGPQAAVVTIEQLKQSLLAEAARNPQLKLTLNADDKAPFGAIIKVMDAAKEAKLPPVNASVKRPGK